MSRKTIKTICFHGASLVAMALLSTSAFAQEGGRSSLAAGQADEIIVTARQREERLVDVPIAVNAFGEAQIADAKIDQVGDFIGLIPNVTIAQSESAGLNAISIRGITQVRNSESPVAVVVDGVLQSNSRQFTQELFDVQSIEVARGPQGALYGRNATGGAIIITTRQPTNDFEGHVRAGYATGDERMIEGSASGPIIEDRLQFRVGARYLDRDGYFDNPVIGKKQDPYKDFTVRGLLKWMPSDNLTFALNGSRSRTRGGALDFRFQQAVLNPDGTLAGMDFTIPGDADKVERTFYSNNRGQDDRDIDELSLKADLDLDFATLTSVTGYVRLKEYTAGDAAPYSASLDGTQTQYTDVESWSQELRLTSPSDQRFRWMAGFYYISIDRFISTTTGVDTGDGIRRVIRTPAFDAATNPTATFLADDNDNEDIAGFANIAYDILPGLEASAALRYDRETRHQHVSPLNTSGAPGAENQATFEKWQPKVTLSYKPTDTVNIYGSYGVGFRSGQFNQNGTAALAAAGGVSGVFDLVPQENTTTGEIGFKTEFADRRVRLNGALFRTNVENQQYFVFLSAVGAQVLVPIDKVHLFGAELELTANLAEGLDAYASVGFTDSDIKQYGANPAAKGNDAPYAPKTTINAGVQYRTPIYGSLGLFSRLDYRRLGKQYWDPENSTPRSAVDLVDARLGLENIDRTWSITVSAENLFDKKYNSEFVIPGFAHAAAPRIWRIDLRYSF